MDRLRVPGVFPGLLLLLLLGMTPAAVHATKYAGEFLSIGVGPRALGMGGAFVAVADDVTSGYWNPAGLAFLSRRAAMVMHSEQLAGLAYDYAAYAHPLPPGRRQAGVGVSVIRLGVDDIPLTRLPDPSQPIDAPLGNGQRNRPFVERYVSDAEYAVLLSFASRVTPRLAFGGNLKIIRKSVGVAGALGAGLDASLLVRPARGLSFGAQVMNLTTTVLAWDTGRKEYLNPLLKTGFAYEREVARLHGRVVVAADADVRFEGRHKTDAQSLGQASVSTHLGIEYVLQNTVALRVGSEATGVTAGAGVRVPAVAVRRHRIVPGVEYAFVSHNAFGTIHRIAAFVEF
ncbi:MAG: PorV/PorQ family protein [Candidatus Latescibacteria bacterium]|nr:PorV/PorQ family protein [Candidatus Latescibacterota bacterium]